MHSLLTRPPAKSTCAGYQRISLAIFALSFAFNVLIKAWAALCTLGLCQEDMGACGGIGRVTTEGHVQGLGDFLMDAWRGPFLMAVGWKAT